MSHFIYNVMITSRFYYYVLIKTTLRNAKKFSYLSRITCNGPHHGKNHLTPSKWLTRELRNHFELHHRDPNRNVMVFFLSNSFLKLVRLQKIFARPNSNRLFSYLKVDRDNCSVTFQVTKCNFFQFSPMIE